VFTVTRHFKSLRSRRSSYTSAGPFEAQARPKPGALERFGAHTNLSDNRIATMTTTLKSLLVAAVLATFAAASFAQAPAAPEAPQHMAHHHHHRHHPHHHKHHGHHQHQGHHAPQARTGQ
jgi:hypothetical protein